MGFLASLFGGGNNHSAYNGGQLAELQRMGIQNYVSNVKSGLGGVMIDTMDDNPEMLALNSPGRFKILAAQGQYGDKLKSPEAINDYVKSARDNYSATDHASSIVPPGVTQFNADHVGGDATKPNFQPSVDSWITPGGVYRNLIQGFSNLTQGKGFHTYPFPAPTVQMPQNSFESLAGSAKPMSDKPGAGAENFTARSQWYANPFNGMGPGQFDVPGQDSSDVGSALWGGGGK